MSKTWYPVINYENCIECGACYKKCTHGVFKLKDNTPIVINPEGCIQGCHGCGNLCPVGAIEYVGDNTGWIPAGKKVEKAEACCSDNNEQGCCEGSKCCS